MDKIKEIIKIVLLVILLILIGTFVINLLPIFIILFIIYLIINSFKKNNLDNEQEKIITKKTKKRTKDMSDIDLAMHMSEKINKKWKNLTFSKSYTKMFQKNGFSLRRISFFLTKIT